MNDKEKKTYRKVLNKFYAVCCCFCCWEIVQIKSNARAALLCFQCPLCTVCTMCISLSCFWLRVSECWCACVCVSVCVNLCLRVCVCVCLFMRRMLVSSTFFAPSSSHFGTSVRVRVLARICVSLSLCQCACVLFVNYVLFQCQKSIYVLVYVCLRLGSAWHAGYINTHTQAHRRPTNTHAVRVCVCVRALYVYQNRNALVFCSANWINTTNLIDKQQQQWEKLPNFQLEMLLVANWRQQIAEAATEAVAAAEQEHVLIIGRKQTTVRFIPLVKCQAEGKA